MTIYVVQYKRSGEDYQAAIFATKEEAEGNARRFLYTLLCDHYGKALVTLSGMQSLACLKEFCSDTDLAYIEITTHNLPQE